MRIVFIGSVKSSEVLLRELINNNENIVGVITTTKNTFNSDYIDLSKICKKNNINIKKVEDINSHESIDFIRKKNPDLIFCIGFSQLIKKEIIDIPKKAIIGFHPTKLPQNKGRHPLIWSIILGLEETASTFFEIDESIDSGCIISQELVPIYYEDYAIDLYERVLNKAKLQIVELTNNYRNDKITTKK